MKKTTLRNSRILLLVILLCSFITLPYSIYAQSFPTKLQAQKEKFNGIWEIDGIGEKMYFNVVKLTVIGVNQLRITVQKNNTNVDSNGGQIQVVRFDGKKLTIKIIGSRYWAAKGNITLTFDESDGTFTKLSTDTETFYGQVTIGRQGREIDMDF